MSVIIDSDNNNVNITEEPINVTVSLGGPDVAAVWGGITGNITDQADLQAVLDDKVPYTGATGDVNLGEYGIQLGNLEFDNTPTNVPTAAGSVYWSDTDGTLNMVLKGGQTISRIGETQHIRALNNTGAQIARGKVVYVVGAQGQRLTIALADADTEILSKDTIGFTSEAIADGAEGFVIVQGVINNISTTGMSDGATVYLSQTAGGYTTTPPVDPAHLVVLGFIVNGGSGGAGSIYVKVDNGYELGELHDVNTTGATNGQVLTYNGTTWVASTNGSGTVTSIATSAPITGGTITTSGTIGITQAGAAADGYLSATDWNTFNNKQAALSFDSTPTNGSTNPVTSDGVFDALALKQNTLTLTTTGTSGAATLVGSTLNIPQYQGVLTNPVTGTGTSGQVAYWSGTNTQTGSSNLFWDEANNRLGVGLNTGLTARAHIRGSGTTSATTALLVQNSTPSALLQVNDDGSIRIGNAGATSPSIFTATTGSGTINLSGTNLQFVSFTGAQAATSGAFLFMSGLGSMSQTSGSQVFFGLSSGFNPTSGTAEFTGLRYTGTINQTGGANGITRGLYVNPTLTAAADWRSIEFSNNTGWGLYGAGTANNYLAGSLGIGTTSLSNSALAIQRNITGTTSVISVNNTSVVQSDVTSVARYFATNAATQAATFNLGLIIHYSAGQSVFGLNSTVTNQYGYFVSSGLTGATNNFAFRGELASAANNWNLYMNGTANNYLAGGLGIGTTNLSTAQNLNIFKNVTGATSVQSIQNVGIIQNDVTSSYIGISNAIRTAAATFNIADVILYSAGTSSIGAGSTATNVTGYSVSNFGFGTNNFGFRGQIASGTDKWNIYIDGTASNYLAGNTSIGTTTSSGRLTVRGAGTTSATNGLLVEDSAGTDTFTIRDDGGYAFKGGTVGLAQTGYTTFTNLTTDRTCNANATTVEELADILGTLIEDLKTKGIIAA